MTKTSKFLLAMGLQVVIILVLVVSKSMWLTAYQEVLLRVNIIDPRDPFRGDYLALAYDINQVYQPYPNWQSFTDGATVYVILDEEGNHWRAKEVSLDQPHGTGQVFIKGKITKRSGLNNQPAFNPQAGLLTIQYGIEDYFIPEGKGQSSDLAANDDQVYAKVRLDVNGQPSLKQLYVNKKPWP